MSKGTFTAKIFLALTLACACAAVMPVEREAAVAATHISGPSHSPSQSPSDLEPLVKRGNVVMPDDEEDDGGSSETPEWKNNPMVLVVPAACVLASVVWVVVRLASVPWFYFIKPFLDAYRGD